MLFLFIFRPPLFFSRFLWSTLTLNLKYLPQYFSYTCLKLYFQFAICNNAHSNTHIKYFCQNVCVYFRKCIVLLEFSSGLENSVFRFCLRWLLYVLCEFPFCGVSRQLKCDFYRTQQ